MSLYVSLHDTKQHPTVNPSLTLPKHWKYAKETRILTWGRWDKFSLIKQRKHRKQRRCQHHPNRSVRMCLCHLNPLESSCGDKLQQWAVAFQVLVESSPCCPSGTARHTQVSDLEKPGHQSFKLFQRVFKHWWILGDCNTAERYPQSFKWSSDWLCRNQGFSSSSSSSLYSMKSKQGLDMPILLKPKKILRDSAFATARVSLSLSLSLSLSIITACSI